MYIPFVEENLRSFRKTISQGKIMLNYCSQLKLEQLKFEREGKRKRSESWQIATIQDFPYYFPLNQLPRPPPRSW